MGTAVATLHALVGALWLGAMVYSLGVVQPRIGRLFTDPVRCEDVYRELAANNRWRVIAMISVLAASGVVLGVLAGGGDGWWWSMIAAKVVLLGSAAGCFWWVSWRGWPARIFALPAELPALQRRFRLVAMVMAALVGIAFTLGELVGC